MLTIDCKDILSIKNDLLVFVADKVEAIPTLKHHQFTLSTFDDDEIIDIASVISAIKEYLDSIAEYWTESGYRIPGEFVVTAGIKPSNNWDQ